jgi:uncharacterized repeat protein (TIGR04052 family)
MKVSHKKQNIQIRACRNSSSLRPLALVPWAILCVAAAACSASDRTDVALLRDLPEPGSEVEPGAVPTAGGVRLSLSAGGVAIRSATYSVTHASNGARLSGPIDVADPQASLSVFLSLPAALGYSARLEARTELGGTCVGTASFDVTAGQTATVAVELLCEPTASASGDVRVVGTLVPAPVCPTIDVAAQPLTTSVGSNVQLTASSAASTTTHWQATSGTIDAPNALSARFQCLSPGPATITLTASAPGCTRSRSFTVNCVAEDAGAPASSLGAACTALGAACEFGSSRAIDAEGVAACQAAATRGDETTCSALAANCTATCGAALCRTIGSFCHSVDPGTGPLHACHELGHAGDAAVCLTQARDCLARCGAARAEAEAAAGAGGAGGASTLPPEPANTGGAGGSSSTSPTNPTNPLAVQFRANWGDSEFGCGVDLPQGAVAGRSRQLQDLRLFVHDVRLLTAAGGEVPVTLDVQAPYQSEGVALLDFEDGSGLCLNGDVATRNTLTGEAASADAVGIAFRLGVPQPLNHRDPATLPQPLQAGGMNWGWLQGYRFLRAEVATSGGGFATTSTLLHLGSVGCSGSPQAGTVTCSRPNRPEVRLSPFNPNTQRIVIDVGALFAGAETGQDTVCHGSGVGCASMFTALGVDVDTGQPLSTQSVFRVE